MSLILIFKARIKIYSIFLDKRCMLSVCFICQLADNILPWNLKEFSHSLQAKSLGMPRSSSGLRTIATLCRAKISISQIQKGKMPLTYLLLRFCLYQELWDIYFLETSVLFGQSSGAESASRHCWCLLCPVGHEEREPRRNYLKLKKIPLPFSTLYKDIITSVSIVYPAKSFSACTSKKEEAVCFAAITMFMPKLQRVM